MVRTSSSCLPSRYRSAIVAGLLLIAVASSGCKYFKRQEQAPVTTASAQAAAPEPTPVTSEQQLSLQQIAEKLEAAETQKALVGQKLDKDATKLDKSGGGIPGGSNGDLTPEQRDALVKRVEDEKGSRQKLLQDILDRDKRIDELKADIADLRRKLPDTESFAVQEGGRHDRIAMDYLIKRGLSTDKAYNIVSQVNLFDGLLPGFRVWVMYNPSNGQFGTWVSKGAATVTPTEHQVRMKALLEDELNEAREQNAALTTELAGANERAAAAETDAKAKADEADAAKQAAAEAERQRLASENTVTFVVSSKKRLRDAKIIDRGFKILRLDLPDAQQLNLAEADELPAVDAAAVGLKRIKKATVAPRDLVLNRDYAVQVDASGSALTVRILNRERFIRARVFVVALED